ncbi:MAG: DUF6798 domain-containing protein [Rubricoccaceae bacterium]|nr:DUF6798 domain-containing protein [Rubricoccaceae bacterium]
MSRTAPPAVVADGGRPPLAVPLALVVAHFWVRGLGYGSSDQDEMLPQVLHRLDPALYARDWFIESQAGAVTVRTAFVEGLAAAARVVPLEAAATAGHVLVLFAVAWGAYRLAYSLVPDRLGAALGAFLAVVGLPGWTLGGNALVYTRLLPESLAWALALPAARRFIEGERVVPALLLGAAAWFHLLAAAHAAALLGVVGLWQAARSRSRAAAGRAVLFGVVAAVVAAPLALPAVLAAPLAGPTVPGVSGFHAVARLRVPHHLLPSAFALSHYARFGVLTVAGLGALWALRRSGRLRHDRFLVRALAVVAGLCGIAVVFTEVMPVLFVAQLQFFKLTVWATTLFALLLGAWAAMALPERWRRVGAAMLGSRWTLGGVLSALLLTGAAVAAGLGPAADRYEPVQHAATDLGRVEAWARHHTPRDALFLIPPTNTTFRTRARRSVVVNFKPTPFQPRGIEVWLARMLAVAPLEVPEAGRGFQEALDRAYAAHDATGWQALADRFAADYALVDLRATASPPLGAPAVRSGDWAVYRLR